VAIEGQRVKVTAVAVKSSSRRKDQSSGAARRRPIMPPLMIGWTTVSVRKIGNRRYRYLNTAADQHRAKGEEAMITTTRMTMPLYFSATP
jgi:hypothetical protein